MIWKKSISIAITLVLLVSVFLQIAAYAEYDMPYYIEVDITNQITTVYSTKDGSIVRQMICSSGINGSTPLGKWAMVPKGRASERTAWTYLAEYKCYVKYATRVHLGYMFHSLPYNSKTDELPDQEAEAALGTPASHGCIRLRWEDAYFIAKNCAVGTKVNFFESGEVDEDLRTLLKESSYTNEEGMSYHEFLGYSSDSLGRGSAGENVADIQQRLIDLGYYEGETTGQYDTNTISAVKRVQADLGMPQNGVASAELQAKLYSDDAPVSSGKTTLKIGNSGPIVKKLQDALKQIGLYSGDSNGIFGPELEESVKQFQGTCNFTADGIATPILQQILYYEIELIKDACGEDFTVEKKTESIVLATVKSETNIIIRSDKSADSHEVGKLKDGNTVIVNGTDGDWAKITFGDKSGYVKKKYLVPYQQTNTVLNFSGSNGNYSIGHTMEEYQNGAQSLAQKYENGVPTEWKAVPVAEEETEYVTVSTGSNDVGLNLRSGPGSSYEVLCEVPNGTVLAVEKSEDGWTYVEFNGQYGYLMNDYLSFGTDIDDEDYDTTTAVTVNDANVFDSASEDANKIGTLNKGTEVAVLNMADGDYVQISIQGHEGFVRETDLQFVLN